MRTNDIISSVTLFALEYAYDIKAVTFLAISAALQYIGFQLSLSGIQDFVMWLITAASAIVGVYYAWVNIESKKLDNLKKKKELEKDENNS